MSGSIVSFGGSSSITITELLTALQSVRRGYDETSLTNYSTTALPAIAAGSICEIAGSIYRFSTEEPVSTTSITSTANFTYFVELVPSSSTVTAQFSSTIPSWRDDYNGWYLSTASNHRVISEMEKEGTSTLYYYKQEFKYLNRNREKYISIISTVISTAASQSQVSHYITNISTNRIIEATNNLHITGSTLGFEWECDPAWYSDMRMFSTQIVFTNSTTSRNTSVCAICNITYI